MTDKEKIREEVQRLQSELIQEKEKGFCSETDDACILELQNVLTYIDSLQEEPVSDDLEEEFNRFHENHKHTSRNLELLEWGLDIARHFTEWQKEQDKETIEIAEDHAMFAGMEKMKEEMMKNIWKPADGDDLPEIDREVVVFTKDFPNDAGIMAVAIGHRPNPEGWDGKSLSTGKVEHYMPRCYDKGGWNIPNVKYWLDTELPFKEE